MATRIPGGLTDWSRGLKYFWSDPQLEPKQQHRFIANFPVYMPGDVVHRSPMRGDSRYLAELLAGHHAEEDKAKEVEFTRLTIINNICSNIVAGKAYNYTPTGEGTINGNRTVMLFSGRFKLIPPSMSFRETLSKSGDGGAEAWTQIIEATKGIHDNKWAAKVFGMPSGVPNAAKKAVVFNNELRSDFLYAWDVFAADRENGIAEWVRTRISPYVVTSFSPPSYGVNVGKTTIQGMAEGVVNDPANRTKMDTVTLTLVSTLQDDLHFSLNFLYHISALGGGGTIQPYLYPGRIWGTDSETKEVNDGVLVIAEMAAGHKTAFGSIGNQERGKHDDDSEAPDIVFPHVPSLGILSPVDKDGNMLNGTIVGLHKFRNPYILTVDSTPFDYNGAELVKTTITLGSSASDTGFYSYQTFVDNAGDTRFPPKKKIIGYSNEIGVKTPLLEALNAGVSEYPNFLSKDGGLNQKRGVLDTQMQEFRMRELLERDQIIKKAIATGDPHKMNELVTKGISGIEAAEQARIEEEQRRRREEEERQEQHRQRIHDEQQRHQVELMNDGAERRRQEHLDGLARDEHARDWGTDEEIFEDQANDVYQEGLAREYESQERNDAIQEHIDTETARLNEEARLERVRTEQVVQQTSDAFEPAPDYTEGYDPMEGTDPPDDFTAWQGSEGYNPDEDYGRENEVDPNWDDSQPGPWNDPDLMDNDPPHEPIPEPPGGTALNPPPPPSPGSTED